MNLREKYKRLIDFIGSSNVSNLTIFENKGVLYISGTTSSYVKDKLWDLYNDIDPDMRDGDLILNIEEDSNVHDEIYEIQSGDSLSKIAGKYPDMSWQKIYEANKDIIKDPNKIYPGVKIRIPL